MASGMSSGNRKSKGYRKRRPLPGLIVIGVLGVVAMAVWVRAITSKADVDAIIRCTPAATPPSGVTYTSLGHTALDDTSPVPPASVAVKVLNASQSRGEAMITTESLRELGFTQVGEPGNDPAYPNGDAKCRGQIRFGESGTSAARTLSLVAPCAELVKDNRQDASVDLTIGNGFTDLQPTRQAREALRQLADWSARHPDGGSEQSAPAGPVIDHALLVDAREVSC
ncbi:MAG TPA: envelope integrity protein Cei [Amycolatopsis sp.]|uniref:envelope integrity protein Cei n=1 Tax=Amycolatopsis sp. TaxID=37632 RepID=UPI002B46D7A4|nr:envelope integrity protein Cei [Amycolatopsis sp.]HKS47587.1 envelope integrity protein Cei [Amycolatopsis sp.]